MGAERGEDRSLRLPPRRARADPQLDVRAELAAQSPQEFDRLPKLTKACSALTVGAVRRGRRQRFLGGVEELSDLLGHRRRRGDVGRSANVSRFLQALGDADERVPADVAVANPVELLDPAVGHAATDREVDGLAGSVSAGAAGPTRLGRKRSYRARGGRGT